MSREDVMELGELLDEGDAALIVIGGSTLEKALEEAVIRANRTVERQIKADQKELEKELERAEQDAR
jgi:hypothetical protein